MEFKTTQCVLVRFPFEANNKKKYANEIPVKHMCASIFVYEREGKKMTNILHGFTK